MNRERPIRVLIAKSGLDGHDRGAKVVAHALLEAGFEVFYTGLRQTPEMIARAAREHEADVIGLSVLSGTHLSICRKLADLIDAEGLEDKVWIVGGVIPETDRQALFDLGVDGLFPTGSEFEEIVEFIRERCL